MQHNQIAIPNVKTTFVAAAITVATIVMMSASVSATNKSSSQSPASAQASAQQEQGVTLSADQKQAQRDLRVGLNTFLTEHVTTNLDVNRSIAVGASEAEIQAGVDAQIVNSNSLSAAIGSIYGDEAAAQFSEMFLEHIEESNNFARAVAAGDESAKVEANIELQEYLQEISEFFNSAIPVLPTEAVYGLLLEHETLMNAATEASINENFGQSKKIEQQAIRQIGVVADALASGIIATQPDKF